MKALTLWQPWASLLVVGAKEYETRPWRTHYRGRLAIHAAARAVPDWVLMDPTIDSALGAAGLPPARQLPRSAIVGFVTLAEVVHAAARRPEVSDVERALGNWSDGRMAWRMSEPELLDRPVPASGQQGLWTWEG